MHTYLQDSIRPGTFQERGVWLEMGEIKNLKEKIVVKDPKYYSGGRDGSLIVAATVVINTESKEEADHNFGCELLPFENWQVYNHDDSATDLLPFEKERGLIVFLIL